MDAAGVEAFRLAVQSAARALAGEPRLQVHFAGRRVLADGLALHLPARARVPRGATATRLRGAADLFALRHRHHDPELHARLRPAQAPAGALFDAFEDVRVAVVGARGLAGASRNIGALLRARRSPPAAADGEVCHRHVAALACELHSALLARPPVRAASARVRRGGSALQPADIERFGDGLECQPAYAASALAWLRTSGWLGGDPALEAVVVDAAGAPVQVVTGDLAPPSAGAPRPAVAAAGAGDGAGDGAGTDNHDRGATAGTGMPGAAAPSPRGYRVFDRRHDEVASAAALVGADRRALLRRQLDGSAARLRMELAPRLRRLERLDPARRKRWQTRCDDGALDPARLAALVANPHVRPLHRQRTVAAPGECAVTLLVDNSGSMRGAPITAAAAAVDVVAPVLERLGVTVEILGFTTGAWSGGRPHERWVATGSPASPGRLNQLRHIVYKRPQQSCLAARAGFGTMLDDRLLKENVDGEALEWAHGRLLRRVHRRRILLVLGDGSPSDTATERANGTGYLHRHLQDVIARIQARQAVELLAIGTDPGVATLYRRAVVLPDSDAWGEALVDALGAALTSPTPTRR